MPHTDENLATGYDDEPSDDDASLVDFGTKKDAVEDETVEDEADENEASENEASENEAPDDEAPDDERSESYDDEIIAPQQTPHETMAKRVNDAKAEFRIREALAHLTPSPIRIFKFRPGDYERIEVLPENIRPAFTVILTDV